MKIVKTSMNTHYGMTSRSSMNTHYGAHQPLGTHWGQNAIENLPFSGKAKERLLEIYEMEETAEKEGSKMESYLS